MYVLIKNEEVTKMHEIINKIVQQNQSLFGTNPKIDKINIGFTNTIYNINDLYIVKICTDVDNEKEFKKEIDFYNSVKNKSKGQEKVFNIFNIVFNTFMNPIKIVFFDEPENFLDDLGLRKISVLFSMLKKANTSVSIIERITKTIDMVSQCQRKQLLLLEEIK